MPQVINTITKANPTDNYAVVNDTDLKGSYRIVANITQRDAIVSNQRVQGMLVYVISDLHFYQLQSDLLAWTDLGTSLGGNYAPAIVRYVYLVADASDAVRMGGAANNTYTTFQDAYDAANALQVALGGINRVVIMVGNTNAGTVGSLVLTANINSLVNIIGISKERSLLGNITASTFTVTTSITNAAIGNITTSGSVALTLNNAVTGSIVTSSVTGATGSVSITNSSNSSVGSITMDSSLGNVGTLTYSSCVNITTTGNISMTQGSAVASFSIGAFSITNCSGCRFDGSITIAMYYASSTGTIAGISIPSSSSNIVFNNTFRITAYNNTSQLASNTAISSVELFNTTFNSGFYLNHRTTGFTTWEGGIITTLKIKSCVFRSNVRIMYHNTTPIITGLNYSISDCLFKGIYDGTGLSFSTQNTDVSFDSFIVDNCECNLKNFFGITYNGLTPNTVPFMIDGQSILVRNCNIEGFAMLLHNPSTPNTLYDSIISGCNFYSFEISIIDGDINFNIINTSVTNGFFLQSVGTTPTKRTVIIDSDLSVIDDGSVSDNLVNVPVTLKTSYFKYYSISSHTEDVILYNSFLESVEAGGATTWTGTLYTSTLQKSASDVTAGLVNNNSYIF